jgi:hypothetical protein
MSEQQMMDDPQYIQKMSDMMRNNLQMMQHMMSLMNGTMMNSNMHHFTMSHP